MAGTVNRILAVLAAALVVVSGAARPYAYGPPYGLVQGVLPAVHARYARTRRSAVRTPVRAGNVPAHGRAHPTGTAAPGSARPGRVRVPGPYPARTWPGRRRWAWYMPGTAAALVVVDGDLSRCARTRPRFRKKPARLRGERRRRLMHELAGRDGGRCLYCGRGVDDPTTLTVDHFLALHWARVCGWDRPHDIRNLVLACLPCNRAKKHRLPWPLVWLLLAHARRPVAVEQLAAA